MEVSARKNDSQFTREKDQIRKNAPRKNPRKRIESFISRSSIVIFLHRAEVGKSG
jgi:hypothetical protein